MYSSVKFLSPRVTDGLPLPGWPDGSEDELEELDEELAAEGVDLRFAEMKGPVKDRLRRYALYERFGDDHFSPTVGAAVSAYLATTGVEWTDWEDRPAPTHPGRR